MEKKDKFIDINKVIASKDPRLLKWIPGFILRYVKRIVHEDEINGALDRMGHLQGLPFIEAILKEFNANIIVEGEARIPRDGKAIVVANHPLGGLDGLALMHVVGRVREDIVFPVNDLLLNIPNLRGLFIPVNKHGSNAANVRVFDETFSGDKMVLYFPAGLCSRKQKGVICDTEWKKSIITKARKYQRDIIPVHISGRNSNFFYRLANIRKSLRLKANIEMLYLVDEMYKQRNQDIIITFGNPISWQTFTQERKDKTWAELLKEHVYHLESNQDAIFVK
ncbi:MAG: 1-acyl-sn-glycerol-3-phosphate acyltransferase [Lentimicrobiaceae bacterium]|nr:1-acyl-sn-glycerol-3-phosphate acyltransferase [Lentimicrobiaceae bacterium]